MATRALREGEDADIGCVAVDEFHYYGEADRGWAWQVPLLILKKTQFLLMSATLGDVSSIASSLRERTGRAGDAVLDALLQAAERAVDADVFAVGRALLATYLTYRPDDALMGAYRSLIDLLV